MVITTILQRSKGVAQIFSHTLSCLHVNLRTSFLSGEEKPNFVEVGPFVYQQSMHKTNINFSQDGEEITHSVYREFFFTESLSVSSDETYVIGKSNF